MYTVNWCEWSEIVNDRFIPLVDNRDRYVIMYGGRGSSKSNFEAKKLIYRCLTEKYFRHILIRNTYATIKDSSYQTIKDIIFELGLDELFEFKLQPLEIHCINGNSFLARGCDDTTKLKSIKDPTGAWYEEDIPSEADFITITTSIRTTKAEYLQETFTINPEVEGNFQDNWFWKRFFEGKDEMSFRDKTTLQIDPNTKVELNYTVHHSTYLDNKWLPNEFIAFLMDLKRTNTYYYTIYCLGNWGNKQLGGRFYKNFDAGKNTYNYKYKPNLALHLSFDFNVNPYMSLSIWQIEGKACYLIDEIAMADPYNKVKDTCREFIRKYNTHSGGLFIYGDPSGKKEDVGREKGYNYFKEIERELAKYKPIQRVAKMAPPVVTRGNFINTVFESGFDGMGIFLFEKSVYLKNDLLFGKQAPDGTKLKQKEKINDVPGVEKYHHFSDSMDYFICEAFKESFAKYQSTDITDRRRPMGQNIIRETHRM
jgi:PBSX family phage terminase large subunit